MEYAYPVAPVLEIEFMKGGDACKGSLDHRAGLGIERVRLEKIVHQDLELFECVHIGGELYASPVGSECARGLRIIDRQVHLLVRDIAAPYIDTVCVGGLSLVHIRAQQAVAHERAGVVSFLVGPFPAGRPSGSGGVDITSDLCPMAVIAVRFTGLSPSPYLVFSSQTATPTMLSAHP